MFDFELISLERSHVDLEYLNPKCINWYVLLIALGDKTDSL